MTESVCVHGLNAGWCADVGPCSRLPDPRLARYEKALEMLGMLEAYPVAHAINPRGYNYRETDKLRALLAPDETEAPK